MENAIEADSPVVRRVSEPRAGWADAFLRMAAAGDDVLLDEELLVASNWDEAEWCWYCTGLPCAQCDLTGGTRLKNGS
jgi:hypothetical protein